MTGAGEHNVTAEPIVKLGGGILGYRFVCSCGRVGNGRHRTEETAIERGRDHIEQRATERST